jgi:hypothetical protein
MGAVTASYSNALSLRYTTVPLLSLAKRVRQYGGVKAPPCLTYKPLLINLVDGIYVVLTDETGYSKTRLSTLLKPTISSQKLVNLKNCVSSIVAKLEPEYRFTTDDY